ncbi:MAG TPA: endo alpha-1,4 polygalactosaminidase [Kineosporiaceae bacterium]
MATTSSGTTGPRRRSVITLVTVAVAVLTVGCAASDALRTRIESVLVAPFHLSARNHALTGGPAGPASADLLSPGSVADGAVPTDGAPLADGEPAAAAGPAATWWRPRVGATWQLQRRGAVGTSPTVDVVVLDLDATSSETVTALHGAGAKVVCRISTGVWDSGAADADQFPSSLLGRSVDGYAARRYLDVRRRDDLRPLIDRRLALCRARGFDGVDPEGDDSVVNVGADDIGFPVTYADQLAFDQLVIADAHAAGLAAGLHTTVLIDTLRRFVADLLPLTDFAVVERCAVARGCAPFSAFPRRAKPVFHVEYLTDYPGATPTTFQGALSAFCATTAALGFSSILKAGPDDDTAWRRTC